MKKYIFILIVLIFTSKVFCQSKFPDSNAIWNVNILNSNDNLYGLKGDTLINDTLYNKLYTLSDTILSDENIQDYIGGFRQEGQKVWFKPAYWTHQDILLYDFSASVGDVVQHNGGAIYKYSKQIEFGYGNAHSTIEEIKTENGIKTFYITRSTDGFSGEWYENIGSKRGLFGSIIQIPLTGNPSYLTCFKLNNEVKYLNNSACNKCFCSSVNITDEKKDNSDWINIFPNPTQKLLTIDVKKPYTQIVVEIFDEKGRIIYRKESLENPISLNDLIHGVYFVKLSADNETITRKLIIH